MTLELIFMKACFMLAVSLDTLPSIISRQKFKSPTRTHHMSQVWARCPAEHHKVPVINLPNRSTALTCRHTETFLVPPILYSDLATLSTDFEDSPKSFLIYRSTSSSDTHPV